MGTVKTIRVILTLLLGSLAEGKPLGINESVVGVLPTNENVSRKNDTYPNSSKEDSGQSNGEESPSDRTSDSLEQLIAKVLNQENFAPSSVSENPVELIPEIPESAVAETANQAEGSTADLLISADFKREAFVHDPYEHLSTRFVFNPDSKTLHHINAMTTGNKDSSDTSHNRKLLHLLKLFPKNYTIAKAQFRTPTYNIVIFKPGDGKKGGGIAPNKKQNLKTLGKYPTKMQGKGLYAAVHLPGNNADKHGNRSEHNSTQNVVSASKLSTAPPFHKVGVFQDIIHSPKNYNSHSESGIPSTTKRTIERNEFYGVVALPVVNITDHDSQVGVYNDTDVGVLKNTKELLQEVPSVKIADMNSKNTHEKIQNIFYSSKPNITSGGAPLPNATQMQNKTEAEYNFLNESSDPQIDIPVTTTSSVFEMHDDATLAWSTTDLDTNSATESASLVQSNPEMKGRGLLDLNQAPVNRIDSAFMKTESMDIKIDIEPKVETTSVRTVSEINASELFDNVTLPNIKSIVDSTSNRILEETSNITVKSNDVLHDGRMLGVITHAMNASDFENGTSKNSQSVALNVTANVTNELPVRDMNLPVNYTVAGVLPFKYNSLQMNKTKETEALKNYTQKVKSGLLFGVASLTTPSNVSNLITNLKNFIKNYNPTDKPTVDIKGKEFLEKVAIPVISALTGGSRNSSDKDGQNETNVPTSIFSGLVGGLVSDEDSGEEEVTQFEFVDLNKVLDNTTFFKQIEDAIKMLSVDGKHYCSNVDDLIGIVKTGQKMSETGESDNKKLTFEQISNAVSTILNSLLKCRQTSPDEIG